ncbi:hypothetical protein Y032_0630g851 [Ancylostoma ceylanicum]|uniref:Uncharacterized protein n=1 Tax=Ancylostoma ceylanicum TaxID=53326 RepID=A0A016WKC9_9BILA|nr:hypothetical protein Y032_0630g851 [Ancylostoma ceylanicum]
MKRLEVLQICIRSLSFTQSSAELRIDIHATVCLLVYYSSSASAALVEGEAENGVHVKFGQAPAVPI